MIKVQYLLVIILLCFLLYSSNQNFYQNTRYKDINTERNCKHWAKNGYCDKNHRFGDFMKQNCAKTCYINHLQKNINNLETYNKNIQSNLDNSFKRMNNNIINSQNKVNTHETIWKRSEKLLNDEDALQKQYDDSFNNFTKVYNQYKQILDFNREYKRFIESKNNVDYLNKYKLNKNQLKFNEKQILDKNKKLHDDYLKEVKRIKDEYENEKTRVQNIIDVNNQKIRYNKKLLEKYNA